MKEVVIHIENISKKYQLRHQQGYSKPNELWALDNISMEVKSGEIIGISGPNGSGKSTLLKILAGITKPSSGKIEITGKVASILDIGAGFNPELTGRENVFLNGQLLGFTKKEIRHKFDSIVAFSEIGSFINEPVKNYSNGMYVRLAFSIIIHLDCDILLLDEVLAVGDKDFMKKCMDAIQQKKSEGVTALIISHDRELLTYLCNRIITISQSKILQTEVSFFEDENKFEADTRIVLSSITHTMNEAQLEIQVELNHCYDYEQIDLGISFDPAESIHNRFVLTSMHNATNNAEPEPGARVKFTTSIPLKNIKAGSYKTSIYIIKNKTRVTRNFYTCYEFTIPEFYPEDTFLQFYPNPLRLFVNWQKQIEK
jgi:ABC-type polysaccharide/polyol phosphate transport system ATPase subunit